MALLNEADRRFAQAVSGLVYGNPFLPERIELERAALGHEFTPDGTLWHTRGSPTTSPNLVMLHALTQEAVERLHQRLAGGAQATREELAVYEDLVVYLLFYRYEDPLYRLIVERRTQSGRVAVWRRFQRDAERWLTVPDAALAWRTEIPHLFACCFQARRAFHFIFRNLLGGSMPAVRLRAAVWQSIFTRDVRRYRRALYRRMGDVATLITGPSGTGKELVAQAIGLARYVPFDAEREVFAEDFTTSFFLLNPSALSPTLIESELFGHRRGAFTGAVEDRVGWLEACPALGTVFLDEIGELDPALQVKLLRVLQTRVFQRLGETRDRRFEGKLVAATNRDLAAEMATGRFRRDFYYRLCADVITTPTLREQLEDAPAERRTLVLAIARRIVGEEEADGLAAETEDWIAGNLPRDYAWPGNVRELEQCVRNVMVRGEYRPPDPAATSPDEDLARSVLGGRLTMDDLVRRYCTLVYARTGSYLETARRLGVDRRTVREKIDRTWLGRLGRAATRDGDEA